MLDFFGFEGARSRGEIAGLSPAPPRQASLIRQQAGLDDRAKISYFARMAGPIYYSANPWYAKEISEKYRGGSYFAWVCEYFDSEREAPAGSGGIMIAPSSNPRKIYEELLDEYRNQEEHSHRIKEYRKTFRRLAKTWLAGGEISQDQFDKIIASVQANSWRIWKPVLYVIPHLSIDRNRIILVKRPDRAGYGPEFQIADLRRDEFDIIDLSAMMRLP